MAQITKTVREALAANERRVLASELSACLRSLDRADRRAAANADVAPYLAQAILGLDATAQMIKAWRPKHSEPVDPFLVQEHATLKRDVDEMVRTHLTRIGEPELVALMAREGKAGIVTWARRVVKRLAAEKAEAEARRAARAAASARPATTPQKHGRIVADDKRIQHFPARNLPVKSKAAQQLEIDEAVDAMNGIGRRSRVKRAGAPFIVDDLRR